MEIDRLLELKESIAEAKTNKAKLEGQKEALLKQLKEEFKCSNVEEAIVLLKNQEKEIEKIKAQIEKGIESLEEQYDFD